VPSIWCRAYESTDKTWAFQTLSFLPQLYPKGHHWLDRRLDDVLAGKAACTLVLIGQERSGLIIETPKGLKALKISTIWIDPRYRGFGAGRYLLERSRERWIKSEFEAVYVTTDIRRAPLVQPILESIGFRRGPLSYNRYGTDRHELVLSWRPA
jgi:ribosomal protein S18 acetylase RimI-like enzyme